MNEFSQVLQAVSRGSETGAERLLPMVYEELRRLASARMAQEPGHQTLQPTALVHEAWLRLTGSGPVEWANRAHFFGAAAEAMRRILIERARGKRRLKRGAGAEHLELEKVEIAAEPSSDEQVLHINEVLERFERHDPEKARVVTLKFFGGLTNQEVAETLGMTERSVERHWAFSKAWLMRAMRSPDAA